MKIGTRVSVWYACILIVSLILLTGGLYFELVIERRLHAEQGKLRESVEWEIAEVILFFGLPSALILLAGGWWAMRRALRPLDRLTSAAENITAHSLHERLPRSMNNDELDRLTDVVNVMMARLEDSFTRIRDFTLHASHELKTPLAVLHVGLETMMNEPSTLPAQREELAGHLDEVQRLSRIVQGLAFLAKADGGQLTISKETVRLHELVRDVFEDAQILAQPRNIDVFLTKCDDVVVGGDRHRLRQLLLNLTDNAIKYNEPDGRLMIALTMEKGMGRLEFSNTGPGIEPDKLGRVFDRFFRGDSALGDDIEGSGLGLGIAEWITKAHGGNIKITSTPNEMTIATVNLPLAVATE